MAIEIGSQNTRGPVGPEGPQGPKGPKGDIGISSRWFSESGEPIPSAGVNGDHYLNTTNGDIYEKQKNKWILSGNIRGPKGSKGEKGEAGRTGVVYSHATAEGGTGVGEVLTGSIPANGSTDIYTRPFATFIANRGFITLWEADNSSAKQIDFSLIKELSDVKMSKFSKIGALSNVGIDSSVAGLFTKISVTNSNAFLIMYKITFFETIN